jgi:guanidinoacetate N-methyltransferase
MKTITSRLKIGFLKQRIDWTKAPAVYDEHTLRIAEHPVMEDWEQGYMEMLARIATSNSGRVLELGYGLGLSSRAIQAHDIENHFVIECHPDVIARGVVDMREAIEQNKFHILSGFWEDVTPLLNEDSFDGILFDTYPLNEEEIHKNHFWFFREAYRLLKPGGILTYYSDESKEFSEMHLQKLLDAGFRAEEINFEICDVHPPADCEYWTEPTMIAPVIRK